MLATYHAIKTLMDRYDISLYIWNLLELVQLGGVVGSARGLKPC